MLITVYLVLICTISLVTSFRLNFNRPTSIITKNNNLFQSTNNDIGIKNSEPDNITSLSQSMAKKVITFSLITCLSNGLLAHAADDAEATKKALKSFEGCYSKCMFEGNNSYYQYLLLVVFLYYTLLFLYTHSYMYVETRPPPVGASTERLEVTKPRSEILRECRVRCAKNKDQLLIGKPKANAKTAQAVAATADE